MLPEIFQYDFMVRAFGAGLVLAVVAPTIGIFFVVRRYSVLADTLSHVSLAGIAAGLFLGVSTVWAALLSSVAAVIGIEWMRERRTLPSDTVVSLFLYGGLALGVVLIGLHPGGGVNVANLLFGSVLTVTGRDVAQIAALGGIALLLTRFLWMPLFAVSVDETVAKAGGLPVRMLNLSLAVLGAATIAISIRVVGLLLIGALMVIPVLTAMQLRLGFRSTLFSAVGFSLASVVGGLFASFYLNLASGATVVLAAVALFVLCFCAVRLRVRA
jgi:zinc transport system permease protein